MTAQNEQRMKARCKTTDNLEFYSLSLQLNSADLEIDSNRTDVALRVGIVRETEKQTRLEVISFIVENRIFDILPCQHQSHR